jgi:bifunctional UDP-N-acetylglucosamine pyrophosphorylase/glucosamine-1-phosphate N-acetyltransferase
VTIAIQEQQLGTGHAVQMALERLGEPTGEVVVTYGDVPMLTTETLAALRDEHRRQRAAVTVLHRGGARPDRLRPDPARRRRGSAGHHRAPRCDEAQRAIREINSGIYVFEAETLRAALTELAPTNDQGELYLTGRAGPGPGATAAWSRRWSPRISGRPRESTTGSSSPPSTRDDRRILHRWMREGVTIIDPATTWVHASVDLAPDSTLLPNTSLEGATSVGAGATIGPDTTLIDVEVGENARVVRAHAVLSVIGAGANVGPYASLRPGTTLGAGGKIGTFVETKNARIGAGAKAPHQAYLGDAVVGDGANIGAGVIFANYDGVRKETTTVGTGSFVGSNAVLNAPVHIADGAYVASGSTITNDVGPGELAVARQRQRNIPGWVARKRSGTKTARAAEAALKHRKAEQ